MDSDPPRPAEADMLVSSTSEPSEPGPAPAAPVDKQPAELPIAGQDGDKPTRDEASAAPAEGAELIQAASTPPALPRLPTSASAEPLLDEAREARVEASVLLSIEKPAATAEDAPAAAEPEASGPSGPVEELAIPPETSAEAAPVEAAAPEAAPVPAAAEAEPAEAAGGRAEGAGPAAGPAAARAGVTAEQAAALERQIGQLVAAVPRPPSPQPASLFVPALTLTAPTAPSTPGPGASAARTSRGDSGRGVQFSAGGEEDGAEADTEGALPPRGKKGPALAADVPQGESRVCAATQTDEGSEREGRRPKSAFPVLARAKSSRSFRNLTLKIDSAGSDGPPSTRGSEGESPARAPSRAGPAAAEPDERSSVPELLARLPHVFNFYCAYGDPLNSGLLSSTNFVKFARDALIIAPPGGGGPLAPGGFATINAPGGAGPVALTAVEVELLFKSIVVKSPAAAAAARLTYDQFLGALATLAERVYPEEGGPSIRTPRRKPRDEHAASQPATPQPATPQGATPPGSGGAGLVSGPLEKLLRRHVAPYASRSLPDPFLAVMAAPEFQDFLAAVQGTLAAVFDLYSKRRSVQPAGEARDASLAVPRTPRGPRRAGAGLESGAESATDDAASTITSAAGESGRGLPAAGAAAGAAGAGPRVQRTMEMQEFLQLAADFEVAPQSLSLPDLAKIFRDANVAEGWAPGEPQLAQHMTRPEFARALGLVAWATALRAHARAAAEALAAGEEPEAAPEPAPEAGIRVYSEFIFRMDRMMPAKFRVAKKKISLVTPALEAFRTGRRPSEEKAVEIAVVDEAALAAAERARLARLAAEAAARAEREAAEARQRAAEGAVDEAGAAIGSLSELMDAMHLHADAFPPAVTRALGLALARLRRAHVRVRETAADITAAFAAINASVEAHRAREKAGEAASWQADLDAAGRERARLEAEMAAMERETRRTVVQQRAALRWQRVLHEALAREARREHAEAVRSLTNQNEALRRSNQLVAGLSMRATRRSKEHGLLGSGPARSAAPSVDGDSFARHAAQAVAAVAAEAAASPAPGATPLAGPTPATLQVPGFASLPPVAQGRVTVVPGTILSFLTAPDAHDAALPPPAAAWGPGGEPAWAEYARRLMAALDRLAAQRPPPPPPAGVSLPPLVPQIRLTAARSSSEGALAGPPASPRPGSSAAGAREAPEGAAAEGEMDASELVVMHAHQLQFLHACFEHRLAAAEAAFHRRLAAAQQKQGHWPAAPASTAGHSQRRGVAVAAGTAKGARAEREKAAKVREERVEQESPRPKPKEPTPPPPPAARPESGTTGGKRTPRGWSAQQSVAIRPYEPIVLEEEGADGAGSRTPRRFSPLAASHAPSSYSSLAAPTPPPPPPRGASSGSVGRPPRPPHSTGSTPLAGPAPAPAAAPGPLDWGAPAEEGFASLVLAGRPPGLAAAASQASLHSLASAVATTIPEGDESQGEAPSLPASPGPDPADGPASLPSPGPAFAPAAPPVPSISLAPPAAATDAAPAPPAAAPGLPPGPQAAASGAAEKAAGVEGWELPPARRLLAVGGAPGFRDQHPRASHPALAASAPPPAPPAEPAAAPAGGGGEGPGEARLALGPAPDSAPSSLEPAPPPLPPAAEGRGAGSPIGEAWGAGSGSEGEEGEPADGPRGAPVQEAAPVVGWPPAELLADAAAAFWGVEPAPSDAGRLFGSDEEPEPPPRRLPAPPAAPHRAAPPRPGAGARPLVPTRPKPAASVSS